VPNFAKRSTQTQLNTGSSKTEPPILKKANSRGMVKSTINRTIGDQPHVCDKKGSHYDSTNLESDSFLPKINSSNSISSGYNSMNTNSFRGDNNDIYGVNRKLISQSKYAFNLKNTSSISLHQMLNRKTGESFVGEWE